MSNYAFESIKVWQNCYTAEKITKNIKNKENATDFTDFLSGIAFFCAV